MVNPTSVIRSVITQIGVDPARVSHGGSGRYLPPLVSVPARRTLPAQAAYVIAALAIGFGHAGLCHPNSALSHLQRALAFLAADADAGLRHVRLWRAGGTARRGTFVRSGRPPAGVLVALGGLMASTVLFTFAGSTVWLFAARGLQGLATGIILSAASAALLDLHPRRDADAVGLTNGVVSAFGLGLGVLVSSLLVQLGPAPRQLPYVVLFVLFALDVRRRLLDAGTGP